MWLCDPNRRANTLLRLAGRDYYLLGGASRAGSVLRWLERAVDLAPGPRTYLALGMARWHVGAGAAELDSTLSPGDCVPADLQPAPPSLGEPRGRAGDGVASASAPTLGWLAAPAPGALGEKELSRVLDLEPGNAAAHLYLALALLWRGDPAKDHLRAAAEEVPENALPCYLAAYARAAVGDAEGALTELEVGNARPGCRFPVSPAVEAVDAARFMRLEPEMPPLLLMVGQITWVLLGMEDAPVALVGCPADACVGVDGGALPAGVPAPTDQERPPSLVRRLVEARRHGEAFQVCEAVWEMGRKLSGAEPMTTMRGIWASVFLERAAQAMGTVSRASGDADLQARAAELQEAMATARVFRHEEVTRQTRSYMAGLWRRMLWEFSVPWAALLATVVVVGAGYRVGAVSSPAVPALLFAGVATLAASMAMRRLGFVLPARWFRDPERAMMERYLAMLPPAGSRAAAAKEG